MTTVTVTKTTCDICLNCTKSSDDVADIVFGFWVHIDGTDVCPSCIFVIERVQGIFVKALNVIGTERAKMDKEQEKWSIAYND